MRWFVRQLWYCMGWMLDPRLWGIDAAYRWNLAPELERRRMEDLILRKGAKAVAVEHLRGGASIQVFGADGETYYID